MVRIQVEYKFLLIVTEAHGKARKNKCLNRNVSMCFRGDNLYLVEPLLNNIKQDQSGSGLPLS